MKITFTGEISSEEIIAIIKAQYEIEKLRQEESDKKFRERFTKDDRDTMFDFKAPTPKQKNK